MDKNALVEATVRTTAEDGWQLSQEQVEQEIDALSGTGEQPGTIAQALKGGERVTLLGFGDFHLDDSEPALRPRAALNEYSTATPADRRDSARCAARTRVHIHSCGCGS
ncbi:DNA-binding protein [Streptomyces sp. NPDC006283]|uniref:DNA-binding protein n=1 Tax=Streptomyces sp. NPDC006283 TaxID=3156741 RepID=UPI0033BA9DE9